MKLLKKYWHFLFTIYYILEVSLKVIYHYKRKNLTRDRLDKIMIKWGKSTLGLYNTKVVKHQDPGFAFDPNEKYIIISNHNSLFDVPIIYSAVEPTVRLMAKRELLKYPIWGHAIMAAEVPVIDRHNRTQAIKDLARAKEILSQNVKIWISPEGTRPLDGKLGPFKKGAFIMAIETGAKILPIAIKGSHELLPAKTTNVKYNQTIDLMYGTPIDASKYSISNKEELIETARNQMKALLEKE